MRPPESKSAKFLSGGRALNAFKKQSHSGRGDDFCAAMSSYCFNKFPLFSVLKL
jgi:hypothetical protein